MGWRGAGGRERGEEDAPRGGSKAGEKEKERKEGRKAALEPTRALLTV